ncbi:saccharopine dehydrogenase-like oxidoreductase [Planoprotostelium fungivorum]|uniref:Saccharopine dehydrogenase-like oxidoreductase n=1 Tax=Planoprotostelium fungivorum TaxID=1890364 RepID=A0A2P6MW91_9EUKA|nr:saccharopine dehydrogenase-like oxidoreductase [Planoprotostelium fungivorum]
MTTPILILGAGELGLAVARSLSKNPSLVITVLLRSSSLSPSAPPQKQKEIQELTSLGTAIITGDLASSSIEELSATFRQHERVISCTGFVAGRGTQIKLARAAIAAELKLYVPWQFGVDYDIIGRGSPQDLFDEQLQVRDILRGQKQTHWTILSTGMFTSFTFEPSFGVIDLHNGIVRALGDWETQVTVTAVEDIGEEVARLVEAHLTDSITTSGIFHIAGDTISYGQLADLVEGFTKRKMKREEWSVDHLMRELREDPKDEMKKYRAVFAQGRGVAWDVSESRNRREGRKLTSVAEWLKQHPIETPQT